MPSPSEPERDPFLSASFGPKPQAPLGLVMPDPALVRARHQKLLGAGRALVAGYAVLCLLVCLAAMIPQEAPWPAIAAAILAPAAAAFGLHLLGRPRFGARRRS